MADEDERSWKRQITFRLADGFYYFKKVPRAVNKRDADGEAPRPFASQPVRQRRKSSPARQRRKSSGSVPPRVLPSYLISGVVETPPVMPRGQVQTPVLVKPKDKGDQDDSKSPLNKGNQHPSPDPGQADVPLSHQLEKDRKKAERKRKRKEEKRRKKRKRRKVRVVTEYPAFTVPALPKISLDKIHAQFVATAEAEAARQDPKAAFRKLNSLIVSAHMQKCRKTYQEPLKFISEVLEKYLDGIEKQVNEKVEAMEDFQFSTRTRQSCPSVLKAQSTVKHVRARRAEIRARTKEMEKLVTSLRDGSFARNFEGKMGPLPEPVLASGQSKAEAEKASKELQEEHISCSKAINGQAKKFGALSLDSKESEEETQRRAAVEAQRKAFQKNIQGDQCARQASRPLWDILNSFVRWNALMQ